MSLLECLVGFALSMLLLSPLLQLSAHLTIKQIQYEKTHALVSEADRAFELIGRAIRMSAYRNIKSIEHKQKSQGDRSNDDRYLQIQKRVGYRGSDALVIQHELSNGVDFDCLGNSLSQERTKNHLAYQGFLVNRQAGLPKGAKANGGSLICQSLDRHGRIQNTTLMNGVAGLFVQELQHSNSKQGGGFRLFKVILLMTDGATINIELERNFASRNFL